MTRERSTTRMPSSASGKGVMAATIPPSARGGAPLGPLRSARRRNYASRRQSRRLGAEQPSPRAQPASSPNRFLLAGFTTSLARDSSANRNSARASATITGPSTMPIGPNVAQPADQSDEHRERRDLGAPRDEERPNDVVHHRNHDAAPEHDEDRRAPAAVVREHGRAGRPDQRRPDERHEGRDDGEGAEDHGRGETRPARRRCRRACPGRPPSAASRTPPRASPPTDAR